jgi:hypothetical protein
MSTSLRSRKVVADRDRTARVPRPPNSIDSLAQYCGLSLPTLSTRGWPMPSHRHVASSPASTAGTHACNRIDSLTGNRGLCPPTLVRRTGSMTTTRGDPGASFDGGRCPALAGTGLTAMTAPRALAAVRPANPACRRWAAFRAPETVQRPVPPRLFARFENVGDSWPAGIQGFSRRVLGRRRPGTAPGFSCPSAGRKNSQERNCDSIATGTASGTATGRTIGAARRGEDR